MIINLTIQSKEFKNLAANQTMGFESERMSDIIANPNALITGTTQFLYASVSGHVIQAYTCLESAATIASYTAGGSATGTTNESFAIDTDAATFCMIKNSTGELQVRNQTDTGYANFRCAGLTATTISGTAATLTSAVITTATTGLDVVADATSAANAKFGILVSKDIVNATAAGAIANTNEGLLISSSNVSSALASGALTAQNNLVYVSLINSNAVATADVWGSATTAMQMLTYSATTSGAGTATNAQTALYIDYNLNETAAVLSNTAFNVMTIDYDTTGTPAFAAGIYNLLYINGADAAAPAYTATTLFTGIKVDMSDMDVSDADLTMYGSYYVLPASSTSTWATIASYETFKLVTTQDTKTITFNSRNYAATSGDIIGFQSKPAGNVSGTQTVYGGQISPRFNDNVDGATLVGLQVEPILKGATVLALSGDMRGLDVRLTSEGANTVAGITGGIFLYNLLPASTYTGGVYPIVVKAHGSTQAWTGLMEIPTAMTGAAAGAGADVYINFTINGVAARLTAKYVA